MFAGRPSWGQGGNRCLYYPVMPSLPWSWLPGLIAVSVRGFVVDLGRVRAYREAMKASKRMQWLALSALISLALPSQALEQRTFHSATDSSKSFEAELTGYDPIKQIVSVTLKSGKAQRFSLALLSEEDQKYVKDHAVILAVGRDVDISFKEVKGDVTRTKQGLVRSRSTPISYEIAVYNRSDQIIKDLEVRYSLYYCVGSSSATGPSHTPKLLKGTLTYPKLFGKYNETRTTSEIVIIRESKKGVAPPVPSGGGGGGG